MGNCLDRALSDEEDIISNTPDDSQSLANSANQLNTTNSQNNQRRHRSHRHHLHGNRSHSSSLSSLAMPISTSQRVLNNSNFIQSFSVPTTNRLAVGTNNMELSSSLQQFNSTTNQQQFYYLTPNVQRTADQLTEEDQIKLLKRMALIQQLPSGSFDDSKKTKECVICMIDFSLNDTIRYLPCMHTFHMGCIDSWLVRSLYCPSCMEPVDAGLLSAFDNE